MSTRSLPAPKRTLSSGTGVLNKNDFKHIDNLGQGSFGKVYAVIHQPTGMKFAAKVINKERLKSSNLFNQILNEITIMESLEHPNIVRLETYFENESNIYLILELGGVSCH